MLNPDRVRHLAYWIEEREHIRREKEAGAAQPWTSDEVLAKYRFCNVRRRDDRVSKWLIENLYKPNLDNPNLWLFAAVARWVNWPPMLQACLDCNAFELDELHPEWFEALGDHIDDRVALGEKAWTGAYMITARTIDVGMGKGRWIATSTLRPLWEKRDGFQAFFNLAPESRTVEGAMALFKGMYNHGTFMAGQIVADWTYTHLLDRAHDLNTYAPVGPGSTRGMNWLHGRTFEKALKQDQFVDEIQELYPIIHEQAVSFDTGTAHDLQNCLCELSKYVRVSDGGSAPRSLYKPETRF